MSDQLPPCCYRVSAMAMIYKDEKILLIKEADGRWSLPGGGLEVGESFSTAIERELEEELGVKATKISPQPGYAWTLEDINKHGHKVAKVILAFEVEIESFDFKNDPKESVEIGFFSKSEIQTLNLHPNSQELVGLFVDDVPLL